MFTSSVNQFPYRFLLTHTQGHKLTCPDNFFCFNFNRDTKGWRMFIDVSSMECHHGYIEVWETTCVEENFKMLVTVSAILVTNITVAFHYSHLPKVVVFILVIKYWTNSNKSLINKLRFRQKWTSRRKSNCTFEHFSDF